VEGESQTVRGGAGGGGADSMLQFQLEREGDGMNRC
jgi:hypothetical protein